MFAHALLGDALGIVSHLIVGMVGHFVDGARRDIDSVLTTYLFSTVDPQGGGPFTSNGTIHRLNGGLVIAVDALVALVVLFGFLYHIFDHSPRARFGFKVFLPRVMLAIVLAHGSLLFIQMAIDLNNALAHVAMSLGDAVGSDNAPWSGPISATAVDHLRLTEDLFGGIFDVMLVVALVILGLAYVIRTTLLNVLTVTAPLAALLLVLPETRTHSLSWVRLFAATVYMQAVQLIILRVAVATAFATGGGLVPTLYALATLFVMLKVPGALNTSSHLVTKAHTVAHHLQKSAEKIVLPHHTRSRT